VTIRTATSELPCCWESEYACSIGGLATIIGTPTNAIFISFVEAKLGQTVSFWNWFPDWFPGGRDIAAGMPAVTNQALPGSVILRQ
jgi:Na+/H+ antiporter NhaD/arsenite permease-like protein